MKKEESFITNLTKLYALVALSTSPRHGYEFMSDFEKITGKKLSPGQIYPLLNSMQKNGLLKVHEEYTGNRARKVYTLTEEGKKELEEILSKLKGILSYGGLDIIKK